MSLKNIKERPIIKLLTKISEQIIYTKNCIQYLLSRLVNLTNIVKAKCFGYKKIG